MNKITVGIVGLRFGGEFPAIYRDHPNVERVILCDKNSELLDRYSKKFKYDCAVDNFDELLKMGADAIHIVTDLGSHYDLTMKSLKSGHHTACTVPMAMTCKELENIVNAQRASGKNYMMMETSVYTYQCLYVKELIDSGRLGNIQFMLGTHYQDDEGWPDYWKGLPPMKYGTHAISPMLFLSESKTVEVHAYGSGRMREELVQKYGNPYPVETAIFKLSRDGLSASATRSLFETAREYVEGFTIFGDKMSFEWTMENEPAIEFEFIDPVPEPNAKLTYAGRKMTAKRAACPDYADRLPESIRKYTKEHTILDPDNPHQSIKQGGGHHGSHPHLVNEFVTSIIEERAPLIDAETAANWTASGICAHESAMNNGATVKIPVF